MRGADGRKERRRPWQRRGGVPPPRAIAPAFERGLGTTCASAAKGFIDENWAAVEVARSSHDAEAGSSHPVPDVVVLNNDEDEGRPTWMTMQARDRTRLSRSGGRTDWDGFDVLDKHILLHIKQSHEADTAFL